jgi:hypothetical protein
VANTVDAPRTSYATPTTEGEYTPVASRVSWAAILAGAVVALAVYLVLTLLGGAIGLTVSDNVRSGTLAAGAAVWAVVSTVVALFIGGWVTSQCIIGESRAEAVIHGIIMWGVVLAMVLWLVGAGLRAGYGAMMGVATFTDTSRQGDDWGTGARREGVPQQAIDDWRQKAREATPEARRAEDEAAARRAAEYATHATWYTLLGTLLSMIAAVGGALAGAGVGYRILGRRDGRTDVRSAART